MEQKQDRNLRLLFKIVTIMLTSYQEEQKPEDNKIYILKVMKESNCQPGILYPVKMKVK